MNLNHDRTMTFTMLLHADRTRYDPWQKLKDAIVLYITWSETLLDGHCGRVIGLIQ